MIFSDYRSPLHIKIRVKVIYINNYDPHITHIILFFSNILSSEKVHAQRNFKDSIRKCVDLEV